METPSSAANPDSPPRLPAERPPFNEVSVLFPLLTLYTVGYLGLMAAEFLLRGALILPAGLMPVYIALTGAYAADKEIRRWAGTPEPPRKGSIFVYVWLLVYLAAFLVHVFRPEFVLPDEIGKVVLQVLGIFFGSRASKYVWESRSQPEDPAVVSQRAAQIMNLVKNRGSLRNRDVAELFRISDASARRLLSAMVDQGLLRRMGTLRGTTYVAVRDLTDKRAISER